MEKTSKNKGNNGAPPTHSNRERLTVVEVQRRVDTCIDLRYKADRPILQREWLEYCEKNFGDKSKPQYLNYWMTAKEQYEESWKGKLEGLLEPAIHELREGLRSDNHYVRSKTIDQIMKYSGNDVQKHLVAVQNIQVGFGESE